MTVKVHSNGHAAYPLPVIDFAKTAWENALRRRQTKPTTPAAYHPNRTQRTIQTAYEDALYMATLHLANLSISRTQMTTVGMSVARWNYARALLQMARLLDDWQINERDEMTLRSRLEGAFQRALAHPDLFYARVPPSIRRKNHRKF